MGYTALSRARELRGVLFLHFDSEPLRPRDDAIEEHRRLLAMQPPCEANEWGTSMLCEEQFEDGEQVQCEEQLQGGAPDQEECADGDAVEYEEYEGEQDAAEVQDEHFDEDEGEFEYDSDSDYEDK